MFIEWTQARHSQASVVQGGIIRFENSILDLLERRRGSMKLLLLGLLLAGMNGSKYLVTTPPREPPGKVFCFSKGALVEPFVQFS